MVLYIETRTLIQWLEGQKYGYFLSDHKTWVNYGDLNDPMEYNEQEKQWELSRNRMIDKTIAMLKREEYELYEG